jgi:protein-S-isoprenylcysteine O-methyltransferase Ste14
MIDLIGTPPIARPVFIGAKLSMVACWVFPLLKLFGPDLMLYDGRATRLAAAVLFPIGLIVFGWGLAILGKRIRIGLTDDIAVLRTEGIYRISRNPVYLGIYILCAASCCFALHPLNILLAAFTIGAHHRIVLSEERFLAARFGEEWKCYEARVRRYL